MRILSILAMYLVFHAEVNQGWQGWVNCTWDVVAMFNKEITITYE